MRAPGPVFPRFLVFALAVSLATPCLAQSPAPATANLPLVYSTTPMTRNADLMLSASIISVTATEAGLASLSPSLFRSDTWKARTARAVKLALYRHTRCHVLRGTQSRMGSPDAGDRIWGPLAAVVRWFTVVLQSIRPSGGERDTRRLAGDGVDSWRRAGSGESAERSRGDADARRRARFCRARTRGRHPVSRRVDLCDREPFAGQLRRSRGARWIAGRRVDFREGPRQETRPAREY